MPPRAASHTPTQKKPDPLFLASFYWSRKKTQQTFADLGLLGGQFYYLIILWRERGWFFKQNKVKSWHVKKKW